MKRFYKSEAQKRKKAALTQESVAKLTNKRLCFVALPAAEDSRPRHSDQDQSSSNDSLRQLDPVAIKHLSIKVDWQSQLSTSKTVSNYNLVSSKEGPETTPPLPKSSFNSFSSDLAFWPVVTTIVVSPTDSLPQDSNNQCCGQTTVPGMPTNSQKKMAALTL